MHQIQIEYERRHKVICDVVEFDGDAVKSDGVDFDYWAGRGGSAYVDNVFGPNVYVSWIPRENGDE